MPAGAPGGGDDQGTGFKGAAVDIAGVEGRDSGAVVGDPERAPGRAEGNAPRVDEVWVGQQRRGDGLVVGHKIGLPIALGGGGVAGGKEQGSEKWLHQAIFVHQKLHGRVPF